MNATSAKHANVMLPNEQERRQIFYWLKQVSSYTAWNRILGFYKGWAEATEESVRQASELGLVDKSRIPESDYVLILKGLAHCEEGVLRLRKGDKRVFKFDANGELAMAYRPLSHFSHWLTRLEWGEHPPVDPSTTPNWSEFQKTLVRTAEAWGECAEIIESQYFDDASSTVYGVWFQEKLPKMHFPATLSNVPDPEKNVLAPTGKIIPHSGIWEPVDAPKPKSFHLFGSAEPSGPYSIMGCMNYLHEGSAAPKASLETSDANPESDTTWRLLWHDDRYKDGTIPEEEHGYRFMLPESDTQTVRIPAQSRSDPLVTAESGQPAPRSGRWLPEHDLEGATSFEAGQLLPEHKGHPIRWVLAQR